MYAYVYLYALVDLRLGEFLDLGFEFIGSKFRI